MSQCKLCKGRGWVDGNHKPGFIHYETDAGEDCPSYHYEMVPCVCKRVETLEAQNKRLREALQRALPWVGSSLRGLRSPLYTEIQALLAEPQPASAQRDVPCKTPGCNYTMIPIEGGYVCTKCRHTYPATQQPKE